MADDMTTKTLCCAQVRAARPGPAAAMRCAALALALAIAAVPVSARAWEHSWWGSRVAIRGVVPAPAYSPPFYVAPPPRIWVPGHYNWRGRWIPGHWRGH